MSFNKFSSYSFAFDRLDAKVECQDMQKRYYDKWMQKYSQVFENPNGSWAAIEWDLRCKKALREIFSSATFFIEAKKDLEMRCFSSYYFCLYYALFHAIYSSIFLDTNSSIHQLQSVTHRNIINIFISAYANSKTDIMSNDINALFADLKYRREYYSYITPFNNLFNYEGDLESLKNTLLDCYQLTSFHSLMIENSYCKKVGKIFKFTNEEAYMFNELFCSLFSKKDANNKSKLDSSCKYMRSELLEYGFKPEYISLDLEHQFDEFHTYDGFYRDSNSTEALKITDIWAFVGKALM